MCFLACLIFFTFKKKKTLHFLNMMNQLSFLSTQLAQFFVLGQKIEKDVDNLVTPFTMPPPSI